MPTEHRTYGQHARGLLGLGLPLVGSAVAGFLIHMTDTLILGWYNVISLAAATIATSIWFITFIVGAGFGNAVSAMVAGAVASGDLTRARRVTRMALWLSVGYGFIAVAILWWSEALLLAIGQTAAVAAEGQAFLRIAVWGMFPALAVNVLRNYLSAQHLTAIQLWVTVAAIFANAVLAYVLIFGRLGLPELGIRGAGIASVCIQSLTLLILGLYSHYRLPEARLYQRLWKPDPEALRQVFRLGLPIGLTSLAESSLFTASAVMMGWIGEYPLAAHGIALQLTALMFMFHVGMSQAATVRAGGAYGRRDETELRMVAKTALVISLVFAALAVVLFLLVPEPLVTLFLDPQEPARDVIIPLGVTLMAMAALFQFVDATQIIALSLLRGVQDTEVPMWLAILSYWIIGFPASYVFAFVLDLGPVGLWLGLTVGLGAAASTLMWRFWTRSVRIGEAVRAA